MEDPKASVVDPVQREAARELSGALIAEEAEAGQWLALHVEHHRRHDPEPAEEESGRELGQGVDKLPRAVGGGENANAEVEDEEGEVEEGGFTVGDGEIEPVVVLGGGAGKGAAVETIADAVFGDDACGAGAEAKVLVEGEVSVVNI